MKTEQIKILIMINATSLNINVNLNLNKYNSLSKCTLVHKYLFYKYI